MKKISPIIIVAALILTPYAQELQHEATAINIEVPVRVFKGNTFIDNLTIDDFEVYEDGELQKIEAVYLIQKTDIKREQADIRKKEARKKYSPQVSRNFVLMFEMIDYLPKIEDAVYYFFENVLMPEDTLTVVTPAKTYVFNKKALKIKSKKEMASQLNTKLKKDILKESWQYKIILRRIKNSESRQGIMNSIRQLKNLRYLDKKKIQIFANYLKNEEGQTHVFLFYQKEIIPISNNISQNSINSFFFYLEMISLMNSFSSSDVKKVKQIFADSSISLHFLFITKKESPNVDVENQELISGNMQDISSAKFNVFYEMAKSTGGLIDSSANIAASFEKAVNASENYYLLYYTPKNYNPDGKFRTLKVKVKNKRYRITHRAGYIAD